MTVHMDGGGSRTPGDSLWFAEPLYFISEGLYKQRWHICHAPTAQENATVMTTFDEREKGFEAKYKRDQELQFKVNARRNRLLGEWAAGKLGLSGQAATDYAKEVVAADFSKPGDDDVIEKVVADLTAKKVAVSAGDVRKELDKLMAVAKEQLMKQG
jgi:hypothetical protein